MCHTSYVCKSIGEAIFESLSGLNCFTRYDSCSAFKLTDKVKALNLMKSSETCTNAFQQLSVKLGYRVRSHPHLEKNCMFSLQTRKEHVNSARYALFKLKFRTDSVLPSNYDFLRCYIKCVNYRTCIYRRCLQSSVVVSSLYGYG